MHLNQVKESTCKDNCCFGEFFRSQDTHKFQKLKRHYPVKLMREMLSDTNTTREDKKQLLKKWYACVDAKGKEKQAGVSSSNNEVRKEEVLLLEEFHRNAEVERA